MELPRSPPRWRSPSTGSPRSCTWIPVELRLKNLVQPYDVDPLTGMTLGDARVRECLQRGAEAFGWRERYRAPRDGGRYRTGVGMACGAHKNGTLSSSFPDFSTMALRMNEDGSVALSASLHEVGCGSLTVMKLIVAEELGISPDLVSVTEADTETTPYDLGCFGSRVTYVCGAAARATAVKLREHLVEAAATTMQVPAHELEAHDGRVRGEGRQVGEHVLRGRRPGRQDTARRGRVRHLHSSAERQSRCVLRAVRGGHGRLRDRPHRRHGLPRRGRRRPGDQPDHGRRAVPGRHPDGDRVRPLRGGPPGRSRPAGSRADSRPTTW